MTNKEKSAKEIVELACDGDGVAVDKRTGKVDSCNCVLCKNCMFDDSRDCDKVKREWAESECIEKFDVKKLELTRKESDSVIYHDFMKKGTM